jgi:hypothetical protein
MMKTLCRSCWWSLAVVFSTLLISAPCFAQDEQDDPPTRVARLGYIEGSVSFQPAGEGDWVAAVPNRPMTTGDKLWADRNSRAEVQLGFAVIRLNENTGFSFLNLDDHTVQIQLSSGAINVRLRRRVQDDDFEVDTPNLAFVVGQPGSYRIDASEDGTYTMVALREGGGQATGNGQTYTLHAGQRATFSGTDTLNADVEDFGQPDAFDGWAYQRDRRWDDSPSSRYLSRDVVGFEDLDDHGDWQDDPEYGHVWYPAQVEAGWVPYHYGHWDWIDPWGYTWVDDSPWGYAPFHYGRWVFAGNRWGWIPGPINVEPVYAPALVVFIGGGPGGWGGNVGWFPLGPREVYVPPYAVGRNYMTQVNVSNTVVNTTVITNVYNTRIVNKTTNITNVTYVNRNVQGAVTVVPQQAFAGAQPVARAAVRLNLQQLAAAPVTRHVAVVPTRQAVLGAKASTAGHVNAPPAAVMQRTVIAKKAPPPPPVPFAQRQEALATNPGQPVPRREIQKMQPASAAARPLVKQAPPGKPATPNMGHPIAAPGARPSQPAAPESRPGQPGRENAPPSQPNRPTAPAEQSRPPQQNQPAAPPEQSRPPAQSNRPAPPPENNPQNRPVPNHPVPPAEQNRPPENQPNRPLPPPENRPENRPAPPQNRPAPEEQNRRPANRPGQPPAEENRPNPNNVTPSAQQSRPEPPPHPAPQEHPAPPPAQRQEHRTPPEARPAPPPRQQPQRTPEQQNKEEQDRNKKKEEKPPGI